MRRNAQISTKNAFGLFVGKVTLLLAMTGAALAAWALRGIASLLAVKFRIGYSAGLSIVVLTGLVLIGAIGWFLGAAIGEQLDELTRKIPTGVQWLNDQIEARPYARDLLYPLGLQQFIRQFYGQLDKQALIIDDRWNFGGFTEQMVLERLRRVQNRLDVNRERTPDSGHNQFIPGPKICLINHYSLSEGDIFPYLIRKYALGKLLGTRTWGGVRGNRGKWRMMDGGYVQIPEWSLYSPESQWVMENHGVEPDIEVENLPGELAAGKDKQLETAVAIL
jgi:Peptidase family S41